MSEERIEITREKLYERVWATPMVHLAAEFGISDVGLAKICKKYNIPRPQAGYWSKVTAGHEVRKRHLPHAKGDGEEKIIIRRRLESSEDPKVSG